VLLGDLEVRLGNYAAAGEAYRTAHGLNPRDPEIAQLAADPRSALSRVTP
jgi:cytochrome c-type biogenesis protein CcmH/NrfG